MTNKNPKKRVPRNTPDTHPGPSKLLQQLLSLELPASTLLASGASCDSSLPVKSSGLSDDEELVS
eukprot:CAMPEP_0115068812 /NCGR_PEP_ID=MMETSP0227-20121206/12196_1 /TAXON_ID=89957 /ORGANISM="Polarella glacialis, Strain CCMP 1383" /LENGTH=64 /DNA_ID=CAMNT_0002455117 /DNA_START=997 /DNA_END=1191 /DNA_ORIENTATION=+